MGTRQKNPLERLFRSGVNMNYQHKHSPVFQVIDMSSILARIYYATNGNKTDAVAKITSYLEAPPYRTILVFEREDGGQWRKSHFPDMFKSEEPSEERSDRYAFINSFMNVFMHMGYIVVSPTSTQPDADDVIAAITQQVSKHYPVLVYTSDTDLLQIQTEGVAVLNFDGEPVQVKIDCDPRHLVLRKSLVGKNNEVKGVPRFGIKAWERLQEEVGEDGLDELLDFAEGIKPRAELVELATFSPLDLIVKNYSAWRSSYLCAKVHTGRLNNPRALKWGKRVPMKAEDFYRVYRYVAKSDTINSFLLTEQDETVYPANDENLLAFDYESYDDSGRVWHSDKFVSMMHQKITGMSYCYGYNLNHTNYVCHNHKDSPNISKAEFKDEVERLLSDNNQIAIHNLPFEYTLTRNYLGTSEEFFLDYKDRFYDTSMLASLVDHNQPKKLKEQSKHYLDYQQATYAETIGDKKDMSHLTLEEVLSYGLDDATVTAHLFALQRVQLLVLKEWHLAQETIPAITATSETFMEGTELDWEALSEREKYNKEVVARGYARLSELFSTMFKEENRDNAKQFFEDTKEAIVKMAENQGKDSRFIANKLESTFNTYLLNTKYEKHTLTELPLDVIPSPTFLKTVTEPLGLPEIIKTSKKGVSEYLYATEKRGLNEDQLEFLSALSEASDYFVPQKRVGAAWERFEEICRRHSTKKNKIQESGFKIDLDSPTQMQYILYLLLGLPVRLHGKVDYGSSRYKLNLKGSPATDEKAIKLALSLDVDEEQVEVIEALNLILEIKKSLTDNSMFCIPWKGWKYEDNKLRPAFMWYHTVTRRPRGASPNFLQVPSGGDIRDTILAGKGYGWLSVDFNNQELRILADVTKDVALLSCYVGNNLKNIHTLTATAIAEKVYSNYFEPCLAEMKTEIVERGGHEREVQQYDQFMEWYKGKKTAELQEAANFCRSKRAKACNFTVAFGGTEHALSGNILVPLEEAAEYMEDLHSMYPKIREEQDRSYNLFLKYRCTRNAYGALYSPPSSVFYNSFLKQKAGRTAFNFRMQGCAAQVLYETFGNLHETPLREMDVRPYFPIYDEIVFKVPDDPEVVYKSCEIISKSMNITPPNDTVPQIAEFTWHPKGMATGTELGMLSDFDSDKVKEVVNAGKEASK